MEEVLLELNHEATGRLEESRGCSRGNLGKHYCTLVSDYAKSAAEKCFKLVRRRTEGNTVRKVMPWLRSRISSMCKFTNVLGCSAINPNKTSSYCLD